jgi:hypothetical protein
MVACSVALKRDWKRICFPCAPSFIKEVAQALVEMWQHGLLRHLLNRIRAKKRREICLHVRRGGDLDAVHDATARQLSADSGYSAHLAFHLHLPQVPGSYRLAPAH